MPWWAMLAISTQSAKGVSMKKILLAGVAIAALSSSATVAADLSVRRQAPPAAPQFAPVPAAFNWSGFYIGAHGGGAWGNHCFDNLAVDVGCHDATGWVGG